MTIENDTRNEDWLRTLQWDLYRRGRLIVTVDDLLWALHVKLEPLDDQKLAVQHFMTLPAWEPAPEELMTAVGKFLSGMKADFNPDEPRDDSGKWTSGGGGDSGGGVYSSPIVPLSNTDNIGARDEKVSAVIDATVKQKTGMDRVGDQPLISIDPAGPATKAAVAHDIADRMGTKFDRQVMGTYPGTGVRMGTMTQDLLTPDHQWFINPASEGMTATVGLIRDKDDLDFYQKNIANGYFNGSPEIVNGDDPRIAQYWREQGVSKLVTNWAETSNDHSVISMAMQDSATKEFNLTGTAAWEADPEDTDTMKQDMAQGVQKELDKNGDMYQSFLRAQYGNTQQLFKDNGITQITAYRGFDFSNLGEFSEDYPLPGWTDPENADEVDDKNLTWNADIPLRPLSAFSYDPESALNFAGGGDTDMGRMIGGEVPVSRVLSTAVTGIGCLGELEMVLLGGTDK